MIRFWNNEVLENIEGVLLTIAHVLIEAPPPAPSRPREGKSREGGPAKVALSWVPDAAKGWAP